MIIDSVPTIYTCDCSSSSMISMSMSIRETVYIIDVCMQWPGSGQCPRQWHKLGGHYHWSTSCWNFGILLTIFTDRLLVEYIPNGKVNEKNDGSRCTYTLKLMTNKADEKQWENMAWTVYKGYILSFFFPWTVKTKFIWVMQWQIMHLHAITRNFIFHKLTIMQKEMA